MRKRVLVAVCSLSALVFGVSAVPAGPIAQLHLSRLNLDFTPLVDAERFVLTVASPDGKVSRREFAAGEAISFSFGDSREAVADGSYNWELTAAPRVRAVDRARLDRARSTGDAAAVAEAQRAAGIPAGGLVQSGSFRVVDGAIADSAAPEGGMRKIASPLTNVTAADQVIPDDLIVQGSECVGLDCVNNEPFSFDTIRLKENNLRIHFDDTSTQVGFPANDWRIIANDSASGGSSKFSIEDSTSSKTPFTLTAGAATNSIFADSTGRIGLRTSTPVLDLHINTSNTPAIRLEQNNSGGFTAQTWDIGANEANFFVRDVTGGSKLSFRIRPGAPTSSLDISSDGDVGIGTASPSNSLHVARSDGTTKLLVKETSGTPAFRELLELANNGDPFLIFFNSGTSNRWSNGLNAGQFQILDQADVQTEFSLTAAGALTISGGLTQNSSRASKQEFAAIDQAAVLRGVLELPITTWTYKDQPGVRHMGPMAEDFYSAFTLGLNDKGIAVTDTAGVAFAAIQGLYRELEKKNDEIRQLQEQMSELAARFDALQSAKP